MREGRRRLPCPGAPTAFRERSPATERRVCAGGGHEPHPDPFDGPRIVDEMIAWLKERMDGRTP
jgi:hypothetical protein